MSNFMRVRFFYNWLNTFLVHRKLNKIVYPVNIELSLRIYLNNILFLSQN